MASLSVSHVGLCVSDLERSLRFYVDGLGFEKAESYEVGDEVAHTLEVEPGISLTSQMVRRDGLTLELIGWRRPAPTGTPSTSRGQLGFTHLTFTVEDMPAIEARLVELGATVVESTRTAIDFPGGGIRLLFLADPDGTRIELMETVADSGA